MDRPARPDRPADAGSDSKHQSLIYVHLPFAAAIDSGGPSGLYERVTSLVAYALGAYVSELGAHRVEVGDVDDVYAWLEVGVHLPEDAALEVAAHLRRALELSGVELPPTQRGTCEFAVECVRVAAPERHDPGRVRARALRHAQLRTWDPLASTRMVEASLLDRALEQEAFEFHHQPIVDVPGGRVIAYEALCRGTRPDFRFPDMIFGAAERCQRVWDLGRVLRRVAGRSLAQLVASHRDPVLLFVNIHPSDIDDPAFIEQALDSALVDHADRVVFELTERAAISDYRRIKELFSVLRRRGYRVAIDDLGSGYAGLTALAELEPEFIKFDMGLIRDVHLHPIKQRLLERMAEFAAEIGATTICEGVENTAERDALLRTGAWAMQGYLFARPAPGFVPLALEGLDARAA